VEIAELVLTEPALDQRWFERIKQNIIDSVAEYHSDSWGIVQKLSGEVLLGNHPYRKAWEYSPIEDIEAITLEDVKNWHRSSFSKNSITVTVAGNLPPESVAKEIDHLFADLPDIPPTQPIEFDKPTIPGETILLHVPDLPKSIVVINGEFPALNQETESALNLAIHVFGGDKQARLFKSVRSALGASYHFEADTRYYASQYRTLELKGEIETEKVQAALDAKKNLYTWG